MAKKRIVGITIEIEGKTDKLTKSLESVDKNLNKTQTALRDVNKLLKLDPKNTELLAQKQKLLSDAIADTDKRLEKLKTASEQAASAGNWDEYRKKVEPVEKQIEDTTKALKNLRDQQADLKDAGKIDTEQYKALQTEVQDTNKKLKELKQQAKDASDEFGNPISPEMFDSLQREIIETENNLKSLKNQNSKYITTLNNVSQETQKFGNQAKDAGQALTPLSLVLTGVGVAATSTANNFEDAMSQAAGALDKPMSQMQELRELALQVGQDTIFSATEAGNAITELAKGGLTEAQIKSGALQTTMDLAAASGMDLSSSANVVVQSMGAFRLSADQVTVAANALAGAAAASSTDVQPLTEALSQCAASASNAGWNIQDTTAILGMLADAGITGSDAGTSLKTMLQRLSAPTGAAATMMETLGINTRDSSGNLLSASAMAEELQNKLGGLDAATRDAALQTIFGSDATRAATVLMNNGAEGLQKYTNATYDQEAAQRMANSQMGEGSRSIEEMKGTLETAAISIGETLAPIIQDVAGFIGDLASKFSSLPGWAKTLIVAIGGIIAIIGPLLMIIGQVSLGISALSGGMAASAAGTAAAGAAAGGAAVGFGALSTSILPIIGIIAGIVAAIAAVIAIVKNWDSITQWFKTNLEKATAAISNAWDSAVSWIEEKLNSFKEFFVNGWNNLKTSVTETMTNIKNAILGVWQNILENPIVQTIVSTVTSLFGNFKSTITGIWDGIKQYASGVWEAIKNAVMAPVLAVIDIVTGDFDQLKSDMQNIWSNIKEGASQAWDGIKTGITSICDGIKNNIVIIFNGAKDFILNIWNGIKTFFVDTVTKIKDGIVNGFWNMVDGIENAIQSIPQKIKNMFNRIKYIISTWILRAIDWGKDFISGFIKGFMSGIQKIQDAARKVGDKIREFLHFSRPDRGPLRDYETWMPDFIDGLVKGIDRNVYKVSDAMKRVTGVMQSKISGDVSALKSPDTMAVNLNNTVTVQIGNERFKAFIVGTAQQGISNHQISSARAKGKA